MVYASTGAHPCHCAGITSSNVDHAGLGSVVCLVVFYTFESVMHVRIIGSWTHFTLLLEQLRYASL